MLLEGLLPLHGMAGIKGFVTTWFTWLMSTFEPANHVQLPITTKAR